MSSPLALLRSVWFHITLYWFRRGREGQRNLTKKSFVFTEDAKGEPYVTMAHNESSKNHSGGLKDNESFKNMGRMYKTNAENDGYSALTFSIAKLNPSCYAFFQCPKRKWDATEIIWSENRPLGVNKLGNYDESYQL